MAKFVPDIKTRRWVVISPQRVGRPGADEMGLKGEKKICPFCPGNESQTPPEVYRLGEGAADAQGWQVRVIPNKFPITDIHEVIIHSPDHQKDIEDLSFKQVLNVFKAYHERFVAHNNDGQVIIFCNHGKQAGASLNHPHSQLVVIPHQINLDALSLEPACNIVEETGRFLAYCPDFSQWPYEIWLASGNGSRTLSGKKFGDITESELEELVRILQRSLARLSKMFPDLYYNYYIYPGENWYLRIIPRLVDRAGFELGTGLSVNIKDPTEAAKELKSQEVLLTHP